MTMLMKIDILKLAQALAAFGGAAGVVFGVIRPVTQMLKKIETLEKHQRETHMQTLRLVIVSENMPLEERIKAGDAYEKMGGNGAVRQLYRNLLKRLPDGE